MQSIIDRVVKLLADRIGLNLQSMGSSSLQRALQRRMQEFEGSGEEYLRCLQSSGPEWQQLVELMVVLETWFFRYEESFLFLRRWCQQHQGIEKMHLLSIGCSTGEEPYSMAISCFEAGLSAKKFHVDAIDISEQAVSRAKDALFVEKSFRGTDDTFRDQYFQKTDEGFCLIDKIRKQVDFAVDNILEPRSLNREKRYHVIFCRNLLIYLHKEAQQKLLLLFEGILEDDGVLMMGPTDIDLLRRHGWQLVDHSRAYAFHRVGPEQPSPPFPVEVAAPAVEAEEKENDLLQQAQKYADEGRLEEAEQICSICLEKWGPSAEVYFVLGVVQHAAGDVAEAEDYLRKTTYLKPDHHEALTLLALLAEKRGDQRQCDVYRKRAKKGLK